MAGYGAGVLVSAGEAVAAPVTNAVVSSTDAYYNAKDYIAAYQQNGLEGVLQQSEAVGAEMDERNKQMLLSSIPFVNTVRQASQISAAYDKGSFAGGFQVGRTTFSAGTDAAFVYGAVRGAQVFRVAGQERLASEMREVSSEMRAEAANQKRYVQTRSGQLFEKEQLNQIGANKETSTWRPEPQDMNSAAFRVIVGEPKFLKTGQPKGIIFDSATNGLLEIKGGSSSLYSTYQLRLQTYRALMLEEQFTIRTSRPINLTFSSWLTRWGVNTEPLK